MTLKENRRKKVPIENLEALFAQVLFYPSSENSMGLHMFPFGPAIDPALETKGMATRSVWVRFRDGKRRKSLDSEIFHKMEEKKLSFTPNTKIYILVENHLGLWQVSPKCGVWRCWLKALGSNGSILDLPNYPSAPDTVRRHPLVSEDRFLNQNIFSPAESLVGWSHWEFLYKIVTFIRGNQINSQ